MDTCKFIIKNVEDKNPADHDGITPLHLSARNGSRRKMIVYLAICELIFENVDIKNPADNNGKTPLHLAAEFGFLDICNLIIKNVEDKIPIDNNGRTPRDYVDNGNHELIQFFESQ